MPASRQRAGESSVSPSFGTSSQPPVSNPGYSVISVFAHFRFPAEVISVAVRWYLRYGLSYRDVEELLAERGRPGRTQPSCGRDSRGETRE